LHAIFNDTLVHTLAVVGTDGDIRLRQERPAVSTGAGTRARPGKDPSQDTGRHAEDTAEIN